MTDDVTFNDDAWHALAAFCAERMYRDPKDLTPPLDPWLAAQGWQLVFYVTGEDALLRSSAALQRLDGQRVFYGFLAMKSPDLLLAVRGTDGAEEWAEDAEFLHRTHAESGGFTEDGFSGIYATLKGPRDDVVTSARRARSTLPGCTRLTVVGHSLGAALATMVAGELGYSCDRLRAYASPHPGDNRYASWVASRVPDAKDFAYEADRVPFVPLSLPFGLHYQALPARRIFPAVPWIKDSLFANHHAYCYASLLDRQVIGGFDPMGAEYVDSILRDKL